MVTPLRKKTLRTEELYTRVPEIEAKLVELESLSRDDLLARIQILRRDDPGYVPSECLVYFVRASRADNSTAGFDRLYKVLAERVLRSLPRAESADGKTTSLTNSIIRDRVFGRFIELLSADRNEYSEKLDYFEVRFDGALASLRCDAQEQAWRDENRSTSLEFDEETGEPFTAHTTNPVPFILVNADPAYKLREGGCLADIAPTLIELMGMQQPAEMTGKSLLVK